MMEEYRIDPELNDVLPNLSEEDYNALEQSLLTDGFKGAPIMVWGDIIVDGHNRYEICKKHNIPFEVKHVDFNDKEEAMRWMVRQQLGRRTLTTLERIKVVEKYRPFYKEKADKNKSANGGNKKSPSQNSSTPIPKEEKIDVRAKLSEDAGTSTDTYSKGVKILNSGNQELIDQTLKGEKSINKAYNELKKEQEKNNNPELKLQNLKENGRKEAASEVREAREKYGMNSPEYEKAKANQLNVEEQISKIEDDIQKKKSSNDIRSNTTKLLQIQKRFDNYVNTVQTDFEWLMNMEFYKNDEEISGKVRADLRNCLEKIKSIGAMVQEMSVDEFGSITLSNK